MVAVRIQMETRRCETPARLRRAAPAAVGLADVVRSAGRRAAQSVVREFLRAFAARLAASARAAGEESVSRQAAALHSSDALRIPLHELRRAARDGRGVEAGAGARISAADFSGPWRSAVIGPPASGHGANPLFTETRRARRQALLLHRRRPHGVFAFPQAELVRHSGRIRISAIVAAIFADGVEREAAVGV